MGLLIGGGLITSGIFPGEGSINVLIYSGTSDTWIVPHNNIAYVTFEVWGGGGKAGAASSAPSQSTGWPGAGAGAYSMTTVNFPNVGDSYGLIVGAGDLTYGGSGGTSVVELTGTTIASAVGGTSMVFGVSGSGAPGGLASNGVGDVKYSGGNGGGSNGNGPGGGGGGAAGSTGAGSNAGSGDGAPGADDFGGDGGDGGAALIGVGNNTGGQGNFFGAGGGGGSNYGASACVGGAGRKGLVRITYYI